MEEKDIKVGQRIVMTETFDPGIKEGVKGTTITTNSRDALIEFDDYIVGHDGGAKGNMGIVGGLAKDC